MLLAFSAKSEELDILMLSLTFGNVEVKKYVCLFLFRVLFLSRFFISARGRLFWGFDSTHALDG